MSASRPPLFRFYDLVQIVAVEAPVAAIDRRFGVVLGMAQGDDLTWTYAVSFCTDASCRSFEHTWSIEEANMAATGRAITRNQFYGGASIRVTREGQTVEDRDQGRRCPVVDTLTDRRSDPRHTERVFRSHEPGYVPRALKATLEPASEAKREGDGS